MSHKESPEMAIKKKAIVRYCNHFLVKERPENLIEYLPLNTKFFSQQFQDGVVLCNLTEVLSGRIMSRWNSNEKNETVYASNYKLIKAHLEEKKFIMEQDPTKLAKGDETEIINLVMSLCTQFQLGYPGKTYDQMKVDFLKWFKQEKGIEVNNFVEDFLDGIAISKLLNSVKPHCIREKKLSKTAKKENLTQAFKIADREFTIPLIIEADDFLKRKEELSLILYLSFFKTLIEVREKAPKILDSITTNKRASVYTLSPRLVGSDSGQEDILVQIQKSKTQALQEKKLC